MGLGDLLLQPERLSSHLTFTWKTNCVHNDPITNELLAGCPNGLVIMQNRPTQQTDLQVWEMATHDHVALALHRGMGAAQALALSQGTATSYSNRTNDQWAIAGIKSNDGYPSITTHCKPTSPFFKPSPAVSPFARLALLQNPRLLQSAPTKHAH